MSAALDSVKNGVIDIVQTSTGTFPKDFPLSLVVSIPAYSFPGGAVSSYVEGGDAIWDLYNAIPEIQTEYSKVKLLWPIMLSPYNIVSKKKEIHAPADFQGIKVGGSGAKMELVGTNGGGKVQMIPPDSYMSLDKGVVEAAFLTISQVHDFKIFEICDYFYAQDFGGGCMINLMNLNSWNSMMPQDQKIMMDIWREVNVESAKGSLINENLGKKEVEAAGKKITVPTKEEIAGWEKGAEVAVTSWRNDAKALGTSEAVLDKIFAKWKDVRALHLAKVK
jgi:TRAP-type C4-dicarboxylate transport system substrate-binding protein